MPRSWLYLTINVCHCYTHQKENVVQNLIGSRSTNNSSKPKVTLGYVYQQYERDVSPDHHSFTFFWRRYHTWRQENDIKSYQAGNNEYAPGERLKIDFVGDSIEWFILTEKSVSLVYLLQAFRIANSSSPKPTKMKHNRVGLMESSKLSSILVVSPSTRYG